MLFKGIHLMSIMGNMGIFNKPKPIQFIVLNVELAYHVGYLILCIMGLCMHPFFFSVLVIKKTAFPLQSIVLTSFSFSSSLTWCTEKKRSST